MFSAFKRLFGSGARSLKWGNIVREVNLKASLYNRMVSMAAGGTGYGTRERKEEGRGEERSPGAVQDSYEMD